ncbi:PAS domain-containing sensor histidine kinase [Reichenbachiella versicolor]|uniref:PAS domain-containing sensor histidine kinase n=1 Tax=Reichenbachiella versicolor TaxID=1821036 RepID=UPI000D6E4C7A|nr:PAS domain-containing protein [Reichenbachiella versicolor]
MNRYNLQKEIDTFKKITIHNTLLVCSIVRLWAYTVNYYPFAHTHSIFWIETSSLILLGLVYVFRNRFSLQVKAVLVLSILVAVLLTDVWIWGFHPLNMILMIMTPFYAMFIFSLRTAVVSYILCLTGYLILGILHVNGAIVCINPNDRILSLENWIESAVLISLIVFVVMLFTQKYNQVLDNLVKYLQTRNAELHSSQEQLKKEQAFMNHMIDSMPGTFNLYKKDGDRFKIIRWNQNTSEVFEVPEDEVSGDSLFAQIHPDYIQDAYKQTQLILEGKSVKTEVKLQTNKDKWMILQSYPFKHGEEEYFIGTGIDITENKLVENLLKEEKLFSDKILDTIPGIFYLYEINDEHFSLRRWNQNFEKVYNLSQDELYGKEPFDFFPNEYHEQMRKIMAELKPDKVFSVEFPINTPNGTGDLWHFENVAFRNKDKYYIIGFGIDIAERKIMERELEHRNMNLRDMLNDLQNRNKQLTEYGFINSHLLRAPLARMIGLADLVSRHVKAEEHQDLIENFKTSAAELDTIVSKINEVLDQRSNLSREEILESLKNIQTKDD